MRLLILQLFAAIGCIHALENPIRSLQLQPRNYNPHPYQQQQHHQQQQAASEYYDVAINDGNYEYEGSYLPIARHFQKFV